MKNYLMIVISIILVSTAVSFIQPVKNIFVKNSMGNYGKKDQPAVINKRDLCCLENLMPGGYSESSLYQLDCTWKDENSNSVNLNKFSGRKVILAMVYLSCSTVCPATISAMQKLEAEIPHSKLNDYRFVLVSFDPDRDPTPVLKEFATERGLNEEYWTLLTGNKTDVAALAQATGFRYKKNSDGTFTHSNLITVLNVKGEIAWQGEGTNFSSQKLLKNIKY